MGWEPAELLGLFRCCSSRVPKCFITLPRLVATDFPVTSESGGNKRSSLSPSQFCSLSYISLILPQQSFPPTRTSPSWLPPPLLSDICLSYSKSLSLTLFPLLSFYHCISSSASLAPSFLSSLSPSLPPSLFHSLHLSLPSPTPFNFSCSWKTQVLK